MIETADEIALQPVRSVGYWRHRLSVIAIFTIPEVSRAEQSSHELLSLEERKYLDVNLKTAE